MQETQVRSMGGEDLLEKEMAPHSSIFAWEIPGTEEPGRLQSMGSQRVRHDWATSLSLFLLCTGEGNGNPLQCSCLENPRDGLALSRTWLKWLTYQQKQIRLPWWLSGKESACQCRRCRFDPWVGKISWRRKWQPTPVFLPGKSQGQRSLAG